MSKKKTAFPKPAAIFKPPANPTTWRPTPRQMEIYLNICRGIPVWKEAKRLKTTLEQLREMCQFIDEFLVEQSISDVRLMRMRRMMTFEELYAVAMESFEESKRPEITTETGTNHQGKFEKKRVTEQAAGNPAFLAIAKECQASICQLWALNKKAADEGGNEDVGRVAGKPLLTALEAEYTRISLRLKQVRGE